jgi:hypothetical protein
MGNCRQESRYPSSDFRVIKIVILPSGVRFVHYILRPVNRPSAKVRPIAMSVVKPPHLVGLAVVDSQIAQK